MIGVDLGNEYFKSTLVKPGYPFTIVENTASQRKTPTALAFTSEQRVYGLDAIMQSGSNPNNTFAFVRDLIGIEYNEENLELLRSKFFIFNNLIKDDRGYVAFQVELPSGGETKNYQFTVEEILAMIFAHARTLAEIQSKGSVKDIYLTVPPGFTMNQRKMLNDAVELAGLSCLGMIEENTAAAITYGIDRKDENETHSVLFLNLGSTDFEVSLVNYNARAENVTDRFGKTKLGDVVENIEVISQAHTPEISGRAFDVELMNILADNFNSMKSRVNKTDIRENSRIVNRLLKEAPKIKDTLSANKEKIVNIVELADYENLKMTITRAHFEDKIDKYMQYIKQTIDRVLEKGKVAMEQLSSVEIIGGALRVPKVREYLQSLAGEQPLGVHVNGDEAMTFGAAFLGANSSNSFKVRKLFLHKYVEEPIYLNITSLNLKENEEGYVRKRFMFYDGEEGKKKYKIETTDDLKAEFYTESKGVIHRVIVNGVDEVLKSDEYLNNGTNPKALLEFTYSPNGYIVVDKVSAKVTQTLIKEVERRVPILNSTESESQNANNSTDSSSTESTENIDDKVSKETDEENLKTILLDSENKTAEENTGPEYRTIVEHVAKNKTHTLKLTFTEEYIGHQPMTTAQKVNAAAHLVELEKRDKLILDTMKAKNDYEALIYSSRNWVNEEDNQVYSTSDIIEGFLEKLTEGEDWLYDEGYDEKLEVYQKRIKELNSTIQPMKYRQSEHRIRDEILERTKIMVNNFTQEIDNFATHFPWIEEAKIDKLRELAKNATEWFEKTVEEQDQLQLHEDPVLTTDAIRDKVFYVVNVMTRLSKMPKPKDYKPKFTTFNSTATNSTSEEQQSSGESSASTNDEGEVNSESTDNSGPEDTTENGESEEQHTDL